MVTSVGKESSSCVCLLLSERLQIKEEFEVDADCAEQTRSAIVILN